MRRKTSEDHGRHDFGISRSCCSNQRVSLRLIARLGTRKGHQATGRMCITGRGFSDIDDVAKSLAGEGMLTNHSQRKRDVTRCSHNGRRSRERNLAQSSGNRYALTWTKPAHLINGPRSVWAHGGASQWSTMLVFRRLKTLDRQAIHHTFFFLLPSFLRWR